MGDTTNEKLRNSKFDQSTRAEVVLDELLKEEDPALTARQLEDTVAVEEELSGARIFEEESDRSQSRVLFVTSDQTYLEEGSRSADITAHLSGLFSEVHIVVLVTHKGKNVTKRLFDNVWIYRVHAGVWWRLPTEALRLMKQELVFAGGFRPDLVVSLDPFEAGMTGLYIAETFDRPLQVHVAENFLDPLFLAKEEKEKEWNEKRKDMAEYVLRHTASVRTETERIKDVLAVAFNNLTDSTVLPKFYNLSALQQKEPAFDLHEKHRDFVFIMLAFGSLTADSHLHALFTALYGVLRNPRIGLVVVGDGPAKALFEEKVELLGVKRNVVFAGKVPDETPYYKTADVLIQTDMTKESEEVVLKAAAAGLPAIMYVTDLRKDLFVDGESAFLCDAGDIDCITKKMGMFLNTTVHRIQFAEVSKYAIQTRLHEDEGAYYRAYRDSIELALVERP